MKLEKINNKKEYIENGGLKLPILTCDEPDCENWAEYKLSVGGMTIKLCKEHMRELKYIGVEIQPYNNFHKFAQKETPPQ